MYRFLRWIVLVSLAWLTTVSLPSLARYLRMRAMSADPTPDQTV